MFYSNGDTNMRTLIKNVPLIDGLGHQFPNSRIAIVGNVIENVGAVDDVPDDRKYDVVIDAAGKTAIPGLINCHVHLGMNAGAHPMNAMAAATPLQVLMQAVENVQKMIRKGITTVRDCGAKEYEILLLRDYVKKGVVAGPGFSGHQDHRRPFRGPRRGRSHRSEARGQGSGFGRRELRQAHGQRRPGTAQ
jgi:imidazolonepropionase-like amidohydrolase